MNRWPDGLSKGVIAIDHDENTVELSLYLTAIQALEDIQNIGAERPNNDSTQEMFDIANTALNRLAGEGDRHVHFLVPHRS